MIIVIEDMKNVLCYLSFVHKEQSISDQDQLVSTSYHSRGLHDIVVILWLMSSVHAFDGYMVASAPDV